MSMYGLASRLSSLLPGVMADLADCGFGLGSG